MRNPFFSIIIPSYNRADFLKIAINSVLSQTSHDYELIIVDDGSTDNTRKVVLSHINSLGSESADKKSKLIYIYQDHQGVAKARNKGILKSTGKFICFLDSDDRFRVEKLQRTYYYIKKNPEYKIFHTEEIWYRNGKLLSQKIYHKKPSGNVFKNAAELCCVSISTAAIKKDIFTKIGVFDESLPACEDYDFWLRAASSFPVFLIPEHMTIKQGGHPDQQSQKYPAMDKFRIYSLKKILKKKGLSSVNYNIAYTVLKNKCRIYIQGALKRGKTNEAKRYQDIISNLKEK